MTKITKIEGVGEAYAERLRQAGIRTVEALLSRGSTPQGRRELVEQTGASSDLILNWVNRADLFRIKGIGEEYGDLLEAAGVDTVPELAKRNPENLHQKLVEINGQRKRVRQLPNVGQVARWVEQAKDLPRAIHY